MNSKTRIRNFFQDMVALNSRNWDFLAWGLGIIGSLSRFTGNSLFKNMYIRLLKVSNEEKHFTQSWVTPISKGINFEVKTENVVLPVDLVRKAIGESTYRVIMHKCICRSAQKCDDYPIDFGCIFLGESAQVMAKNKTGREATVEEALEHLDTAASLGLICMSLWVEAEGFPMGIRQDEHHKFMEICFCCPCCCIAFRNFAYMPGEFTSRIRPVGWIASDITDCALCGKCVEVCPVNARSIEDSTACVNEKCIGCGICAVHCPQSVIEMKQIAEIKNDIRDYFYGIKLEV